MRKRKISIIAVAMTLGLLSAGTLTYAEDISLEAENDIIEDDEAVILAEDFSDDLLMAEPSGDSPEISVQGALSDGPVETEAAGSETPATEMPESGIFIEEQVPAVGITLTEEAVPVAAQEDEASAMEEETDEGRITADTKVSVKLGKDSLMNFHTLEDALKRADGVHTLTVTIANGAGKTYFLDTPGRALKIRSHTTVNLNGATLKRTGSMLDQNIFQNCDLSEDGGQETGKYDLSTAITITNGTLDGGKSGFTKGANLVNLGHASNITITKVNFKNCYGGHLIEFSGCRDCRVADCTFTGYIMPSGEGLDEESDSEGGEALQIDICDNDAGRKTWNGVYYSDSTVCQNITVENCSFQNYPSGVGNHHTLKGHHSSNITIRNNTFTNKGDRSVPAIWCYGFDNSTVSGNVIDGNYSAAVMVSGGSVDVKGNTVKKAFGQAGICVTLSSSYVMGRNNVRQDETTTGGSVDQNTVNVSGKVDGIDVFSGSVLSSVSGNNVTSATSEATGGVFVVSGNGTSIGTVTGNKLTDKKGKGVFVAGSAKITNLYGNKVTAKEGILLSSGGKIENIGKTSAEKNVIVADENGVTVTGEGSSVGAIAYNEIDSGKKNGLFVSSSAKVTNLYGNKVTAKEGILLSSGGKIENIGKTGAEKNVIVADENGVTVTGEGSSVGAIAYNEIDSGKNGLFVSSSAKITGNVSGNSIKAKAAGVLISTAGYIKNIGVKGKGNTITAKDDSGIVVTGKGSSVGNIFGNKVTAKKVSGIYMTDHSKVTAVSKNTVNGSGVYGIAVLSSAGVTDIKSNTVKKSGKNGVYVSNGTVTNINANKITGSKLDGLYITASTVAAISKNTISGGKGNGITVTSSATARKIVNNTINGNNGYGISHVSQKGNVTITGNKLKKNKEALYVKAKGKVQKK